MRQGSILISPGQLALKWPAAGALFLVLVTLLTAIFLPNLSFDSKVYRAFSSGSEHSKNFEELVQGGKNASPEILLLLHSQKPFTPSDYEAVRNVALDLELADGVEAVVSIASLRFPRSDAAFAEETVLPYELTPEDIEARLERFQQELPHEQTFISRDRTTALVMAATKVGAEVEVVRSVVAEMRKLTEGFDERGLEVSITGERLISPEIANALSHDLILFNVIGSILAILLAYFILGDARLVVLACVPAILAAFSSLGVFLLLGYPITVLNNVVPILALVLGLADSIHLVLHYRDDTGAHTVKARIERTLQTVGPACALTAVTTSIAFLSIATTDNQTLRELAITGAIAIVVAYVVVLVGFVVLAPLAGTKARPRPASRWLEIPESAARAIPRKRGLILTGSVILFALSAFGVSRLQPWFALDSSLPTASQVRAANDLVAKEFGGFFHLWVDVDYPDDTQGWLKLRRTMEALYKAAPDYTIMSATSLSDWLGHPDRPPEQADWDALPSSLSGPFRPQEGYIARILVMMPEPLTSPQTLATQDRIEQAALEAGASRLVGLPMVLRYEPSKLILELLIGLGLACLLATGLIALSFRSIRLVPALLLPNLLPLSMTAASLWLINKGHVTPTSLLALTVAFGVAVDDTIHVINRFMYERRQGLETADAIAVCISHTGKAMIATTALISAGLIVTFFSAFGTVKLFGGMLILTFAGALAADLLLLPVLLNLFWGRK